MVAGAPSFPAVPGLLHHHVSGGVHLVLQAVPLGDRNDVGPDLILFLRAPRNGEDLVEVIPEGFGFEIGYEGHGLLLLWRPGFVKIEGED